MNLLTIIILVIIIIICLSFTIAFFMPDTLIRKAEPLNKPQTFAKSTLDQPASPRYYYEAWVYISQNTPADKTNVIFNRGTDFVVSLYGTTLSIYSSGANASGNYAVDASGRFTCPTAANGKDDRSPNCGSVMDVTNAFPFQKWVYLVIAVDGQKIDVYLDGLIVKSVNNFTNSPGTSDLTVGNQYTIGRIGMFKRNPSAINPQTVWTYYLRGNGQGTSWNPYHIDFQIFKNGTQQNEVRIL